MKYLVALLLFLSAKAEAGYTELSVSGSYRTSTIDQYNYSKVQSITGGVAYYFWENSAIELNYTDGFGQYFGNTTYTGRYVYTTYFQLFGADLILSFGGKQSPFRPYVKFGGAQQKKKIIYEQAFFAPVTTEVSGVSPTVGAGFKLFFTENFAFKIGADAWTTPNGDGQDKFDIAASAGLSWLF